MVEANKPGPTAVLYEQHLESGFEIGGKVPKNNLSAMLPDYGRFKSPNSVAAEEGEEQVRILPGTPTNVKDSAASAQQSR